jgi:hypothetical protein
MISTFTAFIDANVFYGARLRSLVLFVAQTKLYRAKWSERVNDDEWVDAVVRKAKRPSITVFRFFLSLSPKLQVRNHPGDVLKIEVCGQQ